MVYIDKQAIGPSPAYTSFTYYGTREIEVVADGYRTERVLRTINPPWYEIPGLDFFSESLWPFEIRDQRVIDVTMVPAQTTDPAVLLAGAQELRAQAAQGAATAPPQDQQLGNNFGQSTPVTVPPFTPLPPPVPAASPPLPGWEPGQVLQGIVQPNGLPPTSIPEVGILRGGGSKPPLPGESR